MTTEIAEVFSELGKGSFNSQVQTAINLIASKVREHGKNGKEGNLEIKLKFIPAKEGEQLVLESSIMQKVPTETGHQGETFHHSTPFFFDGKGEMCAYVPSENSEGQTNLQV